MLLLQQMMIMLIMMGTGFYLGKKEILTDSVTKSISWIIVNLANPALILSSVVGAGNRVEKGKVMLFGGLAIGVFIFLIVVAWFSPLLLRASKTEKGIFNAMMLFSNIGFMGLPIISAMYGTEAVLYASLFLFPYNVLIYTYGIRILSGEVQNGTFQIKKIFNVGVIAGILALLIYFMDVSVPSLVQSVINYFSNLTAPLSMMVIGQSFIHIRLKELVTDKKLLTFSFAKLILVPILGLLVLSLFTKDELILGICGIMLSTPVGSMTAMIAQQEGADVTLASKGIGLTTVLAVITMPLVNMFISII